MKNIFKSHITHVVMLALLCLGGSAQARVDVSALFRPSAPVMTLVQKKSFFAAHPVLKWGGMSLVTGAVVFAAIEGYRSYKKGENFFSLVKKDYSQVRKFFYAIHDDLTEVQSEIQAVDKKIAANNARLKAEVATLREDQRADIVSMTAQLREERAKLKKQETRLMDRLGEKQRVATERRAKASIKVLDGRLSKLQVEHDALMELNVRSEQQQNRLNVLKGQIKNLEGLLIGYRTKRDSVSYEETVKADPVVVA